MTRERAIHKIDFSIKAYQNLIDQNVCSGEMLGDGVKGYWESDKAPIQSYQEMIDALKMAKDALQEQQKDVDLLRDIVKVEAQELFERINEAFKNREEAAKVLYLGDGHNGCQWAQCPTCGKTLKEDYGGWLDPYCSHCGQKLDWSFEESEG